MAKVPVYIQTSANHCIGHVECDSLAEYQEKAEELWSSQEYDAPSTNISIKFEIGDWDIGEMGEEDIAFYKSNPS